jgi:hypothetical protein
LRGYVSVCCAAKKAKPVVRPLSEEHQRSTRSTFREGRKRMAAEDHNELNEEPPKTTELLRKRVL